MKSTIQVWNLLVMGACFVPSIAAAQPTDPTAFTFQGQLKHQSLPVNDNCDFEARLFGSEPGNDAVPGPVDPVAVNNVEVVNGLFQIQLDFGAAVFNGTDRWLDLRVKCDGLGENFTTLGPRQLVGAAPYALHTRGISVDEADNVGIGTSSPFFAHKLEVASDQWASVASIGPEAGLSIMRSPNASNRWGLQMRGDVGGDNDDLKLLRHSNGFFAGIAIQIQNSTGNVGIGTSSPVATLHVEGGEVRLPAGAGNTEPTFRTHFNLSGNGPNYIRGQTIIADSGGNVGIGTATPNAKLHVAGNIRAAGFVGAAAELVAPQPYIDFHWDSNEGADFNTRIINSENGTLAFEASKIYVPGNVGIGTTNPARKLDVAGPIAVNGTEIINAQGQWVGPAAPPSAVLAACSDDAILMCGTRSDVYNGPMPTQAEVNAYCAGACSQGFASAQTGTNSCSLSIAPNIGCGLPPMFASMSNVAHQAVVRIFCAARISLCLAAIAEGKCRFAVRVGTDDAKSPKATECYNVTPI